VAGGDAAEDQARDRSEAPLAREREDDLVDGPH
jgi:hypothetical protein